MSRSKRRNTKQTKQILGIIIVVICLVISFIFGEDVLNIGNVVEENNTVYTATSTNQESETKTDFNIDNVPDYTGKIYIEINNNKPYFEESEYTIESFEKYSDLDELGRCKVAYANISKQTMPPEGDERGSISSVKPTGWEQAKYDGEYLYNRCHLIGYQLTGENANEKNLITCTRQTNTGPMLDFENEVANYIKKTNNHVLYRVTPIYEGNNLLASGIQIEASSVEDKCNDICFNVYIYNVQDGITIDYKNGDSHLS